MKKILLSIVILCITFGLLKADVINYGCKGKLGTSINFELKLQQNNIGAIAGETTYFRKNGKQSIIPVFGYATAPDDNGVVTLILHEFDGSKICGDFCIEVLNEQIQSGIWTLKDKTYDFTDFTNIDLPNGTHYLHPVNTVDKAVGMFNFIYNSNNPNNPEYGGHCQLDRQGNGLKWEICQVTPNIAEAHGNGPLEYCCFSGAIDNFSYEGYVDEKFVYVYRTNPEEGACDSFGAWATIEGVYVRKGATKPQIIDANATTKPAAATQEVKNDMMMWQGNVDESTVDYLQQEYYANAANVLKTMWYSQDEAICQNALKLLTATPLPLAADELTTYTKVRSIQLNDLCIEQYQYFNCRFSWEMRALNFKKTAGSQRKAGGLYRLDNNYIILQGCWYIGGDPIVYDDEHTVVGLVKKVAADKIVMLFSNGEQGFELYEFKK